MKTMTCLLCVFWLSTLSGSTGASSSSVASRLVQRHHRLIERFAAVPTSFLSRNSAQPLDDAITRLLTIRGGAKKGTRKSAVTSGKKKTKTTTKKKKTSQIENPEKISEALHEKDAAHAMGDAIRERADQWRTSPMLDEIDTSLSSVGLAMGAADPAGSRLSLATTTTTLNDGSTVAAGGVEAATTSVVVHYFLKSHGGAHAVQSVCSILAAMSGLGAIFLPPNFTLVLMRRCMVFAMTKHLAGILAACVLTARAIPEIGLGQARQRIEDLVHDPVAQYVFYAACLLLWLPSKVITTDAPAPWWQQTKAVPILLTGPILLREIVSTLFVFSDVLLLWVYSNQHEADQSKRNPPWMPLIQAGQALVNAAMSLLVTAQVWRSADALQRQAILARLVSRVSLVFEVLVGLVIVADALMRAASLGLSTHRPTFFSVVRALVCARLYVNFLWTRRRKIHKLATKLRGGAAELPLYLLNVMLDPLAALGLDDTQYGTITSASSTRSSETENDDDDDNAASWRTYLRLAMGMEDD